jgi:SAM-dependent methyltransferase
MKTSYDPQFYSCYRDASHQSALEVVPHILELFHPKSVVDVGCGIGTWLKAFQDNGIKDLQGVDGDYVQADQFMIPGGRFLPKDLRKELRLDRTFDLAISLEVGEHLPASRAGSFVEDLTRCAPVVLFSAAIPYQRGTDHINEQWPEYWAEKFAAQGYQAVDCVRDLVWANRSVDYYYAQNLIAYVRKDVLDQFPAITEAAKRTNPQSLSRVHPEKWIYAHDPQHAGLRFVIQAIPHAIPKLFRKIFSIK